jgi:hypothetical protein
MSDETTPDPGDPAQEAKPAKRGAGPKAAPEKVAVRVLRDGVRANKMRYGKGAETRMARAEADRLAAEGAVEITG